jgi:hypothetical protein
VRRIVISGLVALAAALGGSGPAVAATAPAARAPSVVRAQPAAAAGFFFPGPVSCGAPKACLAVGTNVTKTSDVTTAVAEKWNGTAWKPVVAREPKGAKFTDFTGVSCRSATSCLVVGVYGSSAGGDLPYAMTWNGTSLTPTAALPVPKGGTPVTLDAVSCVTAKSCVAVGASLGTSFGSGIMLVIATWNGAKWAVRTAKSPGGAAFLRLAGIHCFSAASCVVVGGESFPSADTETMFLAKWNGNALTAMKATAPAGAGAVTLNAVSCVSAKNCVAAGSSTNIASFGGFGFTEAWNGTSWMAHKVAWPKGDTESNVQAVSCVTPKSCVTVGSAGTSTSGGAKALSYNGKAWSLQNVPGPGKGKSSFFNGVSCPKVNDCVAFGAIGVNNGSTSTPLAGVWNGKSWKLAIA